MADGIPLRILSTETREDGVYVTAELPDGSIRVGFDLAGALGPDEVLAPDVVVTMPKQQAGAPSTRPADNAPYVSLGPGAAPPAGARPALGVVDEAASFAPVASAGVREAGRDEIERRRVDEHAPDRVTVGQAVARLFGADIANADDSTEAEPFVYRPSRAERRARGRAIARAQKRAQRNRG